METYTARWEDTGKTVYEKEPHGDLFGHLPLGSMPIKFDDDGWNGAVFGCEGRRIIVTRDPEPGFPWLNSGEMEKLSA